MQVNDDTRLVDMTVSDLKSIILEVVKSQNADNTPHQVKGIAGIAQIFGCGKRTAQRIKDSGKINQAISQYGRTIVVDADLALKLLKINQL